MKRIGWMVNGTFYANDKERDVMMVKLFMPGTQIIEVYAKEDVCVNYQ